MPHRSEDLGAQAADVRGFDAVRMVAIRSDSRFLLPCSSEAAAVSQGMAAAADVSLQTNYVVQRQIGGAAV